jgi:hypothetical protein
MRKNNVITFLFKFVIPYFFIISIVLYFSVKPSIAKMSRPFELLFYIAFLLAFCIFIIFPLVLIKKVKIIDHSMIQISNYFRQIIVNKSEIYMVRNYLFTFIYYIKFKNKTAFGKRIYFIPIFSDILSRL